MAITAQDVKKLRDMTGAAMMDAKRALTESKGNVDKAIEILRKKGSDVVAKKADRVAKEGVVGVYVHSNLKIAVMVKVYCETDFVARNEEFKEFARDIAMHIAAMNPRYLNPEDVPSDEAEKEKEIYMEQLRAAGKPEAILAKAVEGKIKKYREEQALMTQAFVKDQDKTIRDVLTEKVAKIGENIQIGTFERYSI